MCVLQCCWKANEFRARHKNPLILRTMADALARAEAAMSFCRSSHGRIAALHAASTRRPEDQSRTKWRAAWALGVRACVPRPRLRTREMRWTRLWALVIGVLLLPLATAYTCEWHCLMLLASTRARWACETPARCSAWTCGKAEIPLVCFYAQSGGPMTYAARSALSRYRWWWSRRCQ